MRGQHLPYPAIAPRERLFIRVKLIAEPDTSYGELARELNRRYPHVNAGCRTRHGVREHIKCRLPLFERQRESGMADV